MATAQTFFFYDLETSGLDARSDRIMQFAGQRASLACEPLGEPVNLLVRLGEDTLPSPEAIMTTGITPQATRADGLSEAELARFLADEVFTPGTIAVGFNNIRFDDEFIRHLFWRNFYDAYAWHWRDGRSRWDLLDVVRMVRALRPAGINWPSDGNRLEELAKANGLKHEHAHDALSDVEATRQVAALIQQKQPQMFDFLLEHRAKSAVTKIVDVERPRPFVYTARQYSACFEKTTVAYPLALTEQGRVLVYDLRYNLDALLAAEAAGQGSADVAIADLMGIEPTPELRERTKDTEAYWLERESAHGQPRPRLYPVVKTLAPGQCPAVAPLGVLEKAGGWERIGLSPEQIKQNLEALRRHPEFRQEMMAVWRQNDSGSDADSNSGSGLRRAAPDAESALYDGFLSKQDEQACGLVRGADARQLVNLRPRFVDRRLPELYLHYRARNFPQTLSAAETSEWEKYRLARLQRQAPQFEQELGRINAELATDPDEHKAFLVEELLLWAQSLAGADTAGQE